jgi:hypothetical protein
MAAPFQPAADGKKNSAHPAEPGNPVNELVSKEREVIMSRRAQTRSALVIVAFAFACLCAVQAVRSEKNSRSGPSAWRLFEPIQYENLIVFPVVTGKFADTAGFATLDEALAAGEVVVTEKGSAGLVRPRDGRPVGNPQQAGASVNQLVLINRGSRPLVLLAGEMVSGGKQDRIISKDRIVAPGAEPIPLDVFCVEQGRWSSGAQFSAGNIMVHPSVRERAAIDKEQAQVWAAVRNGSTSGGGGSGMMAPPAVSPRTIGEVAATEAPSGSYGKIYKSSRVGSAVDPFVEEVQRRFARHTAKLKGESVVGVVVAYNGELAWSDIFASPEMFARYWPKLLRSYVVEAVARPTTKEQASLSDAQEFLRPLTGHESTESEPEVYKLTQVTQGHYVELQLEALRPANITLHTLRIHRTN